MKAVFIKSTSKISPLTIHYSLFTIHPFTHSPIDPLTGYSFRSQALHRIGHRCPDRLKTHGYQCDGDSSNARSQE